MKMKKILSLLIVLALAGVMMVGCGTKENSADSGSDTSSDAVEEKEVLTMGTNAEFPPYEYYENDQIVGIDAEFAAAIAEKLGMELKIEDMAFDSIITAVQSGKVDFGAAGMTVTPDREQSVDFSDSYYTGRQVIIVAEGNADIQGPDDLKGKKIGVQLGTTGDIYASDDYGDENIERYNKGMEAVQALSQGKIDAVIIDDQPAQTFVDENEGLIILETEYIEEDYAMCFKKGNDELLEKVNTAIQELKEDGTFDAIVDKYIS
ncbi:MAG: basic amino acid ABC transporter substrate-binding protein [Lachnospiraceae bacterium]